MSAVAAKDSGWALFSVNGDEIWEIVTDEIIGTVVE